MTNEYYDNLIRISNEWSDRKQERETKKQEIIKKYGWDSKELKAIYDEIESEPYPFTPGESKAVRAYLNSNYYGLNEIEMNDFLWDRDVHDFITSLKNAEIDTFVYTNTSSAVMDNILGFIDEGCKMLEPTILTRKDEWEQKEVKGIRFKIG